MNWFKKVIDVVATPLEGAVKEVVSAAANPMDTVVLLKGKITGDADRWVASNSRDEPQMAQDYYSHRRHQNSNIIASGPSNIHSGERAAYIACRVVAGGAWDGVIGRQWKASVLSYSTAPNPDHHWCIVVGDYLHQLQATNMFDGDNYYTNEVFNLEHGGWRKFQISTTTYNDVAIRNAAVEVMNNMPQTYDVLNNNCQTFALRLLDRIIQNGRRAQQQLNGTFGMMRQPKIEIKPRPFLVTRINEDGTETEVDLNLQPVTAKENRLAEEDDKKEAVVEVVEIKVDDEEESLSNLEYETQERMLPLVDALKIMTRETPVIELGKEA